MSEVPTVAETGMGLEGFEVLGWFALSDLGAEPLGGTPQNAVEFIRVEQAK